MIEISGLSKKYGSSYAIKDLNLKIEDGLIYGFLGPNGAGKSTTMNIITGYLSATSGTVTVDGHDILKETEEAKSCIGYLPETPPLYPEMTVMEYLSFVAELKKVDKKDRSKQISDIMDMVELKEVRDKLIRSLSKGYRQRVGMAQAMISFPDIIILDEPTVGLDPKQIIEIRDLIRSLKGKHTVILSSHILSEVSAVCDKILILSKGSLVAQGTPEELEMMMQSEGELELTVKGDGEIVSDILSDMDEVISFETTGNSLKGKEPGDRGVGSENEPELISFSIKVKEGEEIRDRLSIRLAERNIPVYSLIKNEKTLEDIFLELTDTQEVSL